MRLEYLTLDVFTRNPFTGNPLAIVKVPKSEKLTQEQKQLIAREFNFSETVILHESTEQDPRAQWHIDIFLTTAEIPFAGHPCVGTACFLGRQLLRELGQIQRSDEVLFGSLITKAGRVPFSYMPNADTASIEVPHDVHIHDRTLTTKTAHLVGIPETVCNSMINEPPFVSLIKGVTFALVQLPSEDQLNAVISGLRPLNNEDGLNQDWSPSGSVVGFFFFVKMGRANNGTTKLRTRMILGPLEDPATGAASATLAAYLALQGPVDKHDTTSDNIHEYSMIQGVEMGRTSEIGVRVGVDGHRVSKLILTGSAVGVMEGSIAI